MHFNGTKLGYEEHVHNCVRRQKVQGRDVRRRPVYGVGGAADCDSDVEREL